MYIYRAVVGEEVLDLAGRDDAEVLDRLRRARPGLPVRLLPGRRPIVWPGLPLDRESIGWMAAGAGR
jgi:hypothetical protein